MKHVILRTCVDSAWPGIRARGSVVDLAPEHVKRHHRQPRNGPIVAVEVFSRVSIAHCLILGSQGIGCLAELIAYEGDFESIHGIGKATAKRLDAIREEGVLVPLVESLLGSRAPFKDRKAAAVLARKLYRKGYPTKEKLRSARLADLVAAGLEGEDLDNLTVYLGASPPPVK